MRKKLFISLVVVFLVCWSFLVFKQASAKTITIGSTTDLIDIKGQLNVLNDICISGDCKESWSQIISTPYWVFDGGILTTVPSIFDVKVNRNINFNEGYGIAGLSAVGDPGLGPVNINSMFEFGGQKLGSVYISSPNGSDASGGDVYLSGTGTGPSGNVFIGGIDPDSFPSGNLFVYDSVGIGTTEPTRKLTVLGAIAGTDSLEITNSSASNWISGRLGIGNASAGGSKLSVLGNASIGSGYFSSAAPANSLIVEDKLGVGTPSPLIRAEIVSEASSTVANLLGIFNPVTGTSAQGNGSAMLIGRSNSGYYNKIATVFEQNNPTFLNPALAFYTMYNTYLPGSELERMRISSIGHIGIGTSNPGALLDVANKILLSSDGTMAWGSSATHGRLSWDTGKAIVYARSGNGLSLGANNVWDQLYIKSGGNVGIGTTNPNYKLDVAGDINLTGNLRSNGTTIPLMSYHVSGVSDIYNIPTSTSNSLYTFFSSASYPANAPVSGSSWVQGIQFPLASNPDYRQILASNNSDLYFGAQGGGVWQSWRKLWDSGNLTSSLTANYIPKWNGGGTSLANSQIFDNGTNVGIGTASPNGKLDVTGVSVNSGNSDIAIITGNSVNTGYYNSLSFRQNSANTGARITSGNNTSYRGFLAFETSRQSAAGHTTVEAMRIDGSGNVGIGKTNPATKLDVSGSVAATGFCFGADCKTSWDAVGSFWGGSLSSHIWSLNTNNVGIGTTNPNTGKLQVARDVPGLVGYGNAQLILQGSTDLTKQLMLGFETTNNYAFIQPLHSGVGWSDYNLALVPVGGNVSIGTTSPGTDKLAVNGNIAASGALKITNSSGNNWVSGNFGVGNASQGSSKFAVFGNASVGSGYFSSAAPTNGLIVEGNLGVGVSAPDAKLSVNGASLNLNTAVNTRHYRDVAFYTYDSPTVTGTMKITMPKLWSSTMLDIVIKGYNYSSISGAWEVHISGYNYTAGTQWVNGTVEIKGRAPFTSVRLASDGTKNVILLGSTTTTWNYPKITLTDVITSFSGIDGWGSGWSITPITDESSIVSAVDLSIPYFLNSSNNLGIGRTNPATKLDVNGSITATGFCFGADCKTSWNAVGSLWAGTRNGNVWNGDVGAGNVGIGTTTPSAKLHVVGDIIAGSVSGTRTQSFGAGGIAEYYGAESTPRWRIFRDSSIGSGTGNAITLGSAAIGQPGYASSILAFATGGVTNERMRIDASGNVGIGTTNPGALLEANGVIRSSGGGVSPTFGSGVEMRMEGTFGRIYTYDRTAGAFLDLQLGPNPTGLRIVANGNVGIGTSSPAAKLDVNGDSYLRGVNYIVSSLGGVTIKPSQNNSSKINSTSFLALQDESTRLVGVGYTSDSIPGGYTAKLWVNGGIYNSTNFYNIGTGYFGGSVGIGTTNPESKLQIGDRASVSLGATNHGQIFVDDGGVDGPEALGGLEFQSSAGPNNGYGFKLYTNNTNDYFGIASRYNSQTWSEGFVIKSQTGKVGIGTTNPGTKLTVQGGDDASSVGVLEVVTTGGTNLKLGGNTTYSWIQSHSSKPLYINPLGNNVILNSGGSSVGIGTTNPGSIFSIVKSSTYNNENAGGMEIASGVASTNAKLILGTVGDSFSYIQSMQQDYAWTTRPLSLMPNGGKVGIGTTNPGALLDVVNSNGPSQVRLLHNTGTNSRPWQIKSGNEYATDSFSIKDEWNGGSIPELLIVPGNGGVPGRISMGTTTTDVDYKLIVAGAVKATQFTYDSDIRLKDNIKTLDNSLDKVLSLRGVSFNWKENGKPSVGLIAQEVEEVFPELVTGTDSKGVQYGNLVAPLIEAVKEQQRIIDNLEARINILEIKNQTK